MKRSMPDMRISKSLDFVWPHWSALLFILPAFIEIRNMVLSCPDSNFSIPTALCSSAAYSSKLQLARITIYTAEGRFIRILIFVISDNPFIISQEDLIGWSCHHLILFQKFPSVFQYIVPFVHLLPTLMLVNIKCRGGSSYLGCIRIQTGILCAISIFRLRKSMSPARPNGGFYSIFCEKIVFQIFSRITKIGSVVTG